MRIFKGLLIVGMILVAVAYWRGSRRAEEIDLSGVSFGPSLESPLDVKEFTLKDKSGRDVMLSDFKGKPVLLHFWATWCPPCVEELPTLLKFSEWATKSLGVTTFAVSVDEKGWPAIDRFWAEKKLWSSSALPLTILLDPNASVAQAYGSTKYPETYFIDRNFKIIRKFAGTQNWTSPEIAQWITEHSK